MRLLEIRIKNYRLLIDAKLDVDAKTTLIVGRNNTAKTSCSSCINTVLQGSDFSYNDYPLSKRESLHNLFLQFMEKKLSYEDLCEKIETISVEFLVDYSLDDPDVKLGALSPFIIDVDVDTTTALIRVEYQLKIDENKLWELFKESCYSDGKFSPQTEEIAERLSQDSFILPSTIHSFAWSAIKQYQSTLMSIIDNDESLTTTETDFSKVLEIRYTLGHRYVSQGVHYLHHNDVLKLFCTLLDNAKFRRVFSDNYPLILIDEYQDSYKPIITRFVNFFIAEGIGPQFGFFGDAWQTIYQSNNACGAIEHSNLVEIKKGSNFRSAPRIVNLLNEIRPDLPQQSAIDNFEGEVVVVTCDDFSGARRSDRTFKDDLPAEELKSRLYQLSECIKKNVPKDENIKILMITHKVLATQQGYEQLLAIIDDGLRDKQDPFLLFFMNTVEPIYEALSTSNMQLLFDTLGIRRYPITKKSEKMKWKEFEARLKKARDGKAIDVINTIVETKLVPVPSLVDGYYHLYFDAPDTIYGLDATIRDVLDLDYSQFRAAIEFLYPEAEFSTEHGVKGEEYDNVVFVISKGWNQYQFETYAPMITGRTPIPNGKQTSYERNRNLFYVCCSRPRKRLFFFVSVPIDASFRVFLDDLVGAENIYTYGQYLEAKQ